MTRALAHAGFGLCVRPLAHGYSSTSGTTALGWTVRTADGWPTSIRTRPGPSTPSDPRPAAATAPETNPRHASPRRRRTGGDQGTPRRRSRPINKTPGRRKRNGTRNFNGLDTVEIDMTFERNASHKHENPDLTGTRKVMVTQIYIRDHPGVVMSTYGCPNSGAQ